MCSATLVVVVKIPFLLLNTSNDYLWQLPSHFFIPLGIASAEVVPSQADQWTADGHSK